MKIEKLIIQNLNSIENAEIVFSEGVLAQEPLFLICGETGSGKTTILDAITLALFDKVSRYENVRNKEKTERGITTKDAFNILRNGKYDGKAELHFSVNDTCYIATWSVHKTKSNTYTKSNRRKLEVVDNELRTVLCSNITEVNDKIVEIIGLTYEQFIRSVMLAQGEFNTFLVSEKSKQSEILEMLTGTEVYSRIVDQVKLRKSDAAQKKKEVESLYNRFKDSILSEEEVVSLEGKKSELETLVSQKEEVLNQVEKSLEWIKKNKELIRDFDNAKLLYDSVLARIDSVEYKENKSLVDDYLSTTKIREKLNEMQRVESELFEMDGQFRDDAGLLSGLKFVFYDVKNRKEQLCAQIDEIVNWIDCHKDRESLSANVNLILGYLEEMSQLLIYKNNKDVELKRNALKRIELAEGLKEASSALEKAANAKALIDEKLDELLRKFNSKENDKLLDEYKMLTERKQETVARISKLNAVRTVLEQYLILNQNIENENVIYNNLKLLFNDKKEALNLAKTNFERNDIEFQKQKNMVEDWAKTFRNKLKDGEPCPVCGSLEHRYKDENVVNSLFVSLENEWKRLRSIMENTQNDLNKIESKLDVQSRAISSDEKRSAELLKELNRLCNDKPIFELERIDFTINKHNESILAFDNEIEAIKLKLKEIALIKDEIDKVQNDKKTVEENISAFDGQCAKKQKELQELELSITAIRTSLVDSENKYQEKKRVVNEYLNVENWESLWNENSSKFISEIKMSTKEWEQKLDMLKNIENQKLNMENIILQSEMYFEHIYDVVPDWRSLGPSMASFNEDKLIPYLSAVYEKNKERVLKKSSVEGVMCSLKKEIEEFVRQSETVDFERLKYLNQIADIQLYSQKNKALDDKLIESKKALAIKNEELDLHQKNGNKPAEMVSFEELNDRKLSLLEEKKDSGEMLSEIKAKLHSNRQMALESETYKSEYEKIANECHLWEQLAKAIGTTDGDNFRDVAQAYTMGILLERANYYMRQLSSRYLLTNYSDSLAIMVQDMEMGGELRTASSLSGGETFLVSLALALGLTSLSDNHFNTDMLFIDEGFGTLDSDSLDMVMNTLENLHNIGRRVGIISHVDTLKERIPAQIQLIREGKSASRVQVVRN
ncbi:MAG: AAA family ATPase [Bacteroidales bacterium]|nr:AAA family ATPase [Bacteroidales bacterium]